jgi:ubiquinone/menaquinone biosynthesis C-methylase UbiE
MDINNIKMREFIYSKIDFKPCMRILDLGCGKGYDLNRISELADNQSQLFGIDAIESSIATAKETYGNNSRLRFSMEDISKGIPFKDESFDVVFSNNMLECIVDKQGLLKEVFRVLKPGGQVVFAHFDWDSQLIDGNNKFLIRRIVQTFNDWKQAWMTDIDAWMGRRLWRTFRESNIFEDGRIETYVLTNTKYEEPFYGHMMINDFKALVRKNMITEEELNELINDIEKLHSNDQYFYSITMYIYVGAKSEKAGYIT